MSVAVVCVFVLCALCYGGLRSNVGSEFKAHWNNITPVFFFVESLIAKLCKCKQSAFVTASRGVSSVRLLTPVHCALCAASCVYIRKMSRQLTLAAACCILPL